MESRTSQDGTARSFVIAASLVVIVAGMREASSILSPFLFALFAAVALSAPITWLVDRKVPRSLAILAIMLGIVVLAVGVGALVSTSIASFQDNLPFYEERLKYETEGLVQAARNLGIEIPEDGILKTIKPGAVMELVAELLSGIGNLLTNALIILLITVFLLLESFEFPVKIQKAFGGSKRGSGRFESFSKGLKRYLAIKTSVSILAGILIGLWVWILGVDFPFLWGLMAFLLHYVPNFGTVIAAVPPFLLSYVQFGGGTALLVAGGYLVIGNIVGNVIEPKLTGKGVGLSTLAVFLSLLVWGWVFGMVGVFLSVPLTMALVIYLRSYDRTEWIATLMGTLENE